MSNNKLFVASLAFSVTDQELQETFSQAGTVTSAKVVTDRDSGQSRGFGFVEMATEDEAQAAIKQLDGSQINGRAIAVNIAKPQGERPAYGGGGGGGRRY